MHEDAKKREFGNEVRRLRTERMILQQDFAKMCGLSPQQLNNIENGRHWPRLPRYASICRLLNLKAPLVP